MNDKPRVDEDNWVDKCLKCKHSYHKKSDGDDTLYCRISKSGCRFEEYKTSKKVKQMSRQEIVADAFAFGAMLAGFGDYCGEPDNK